MPADAGFVDGESQVLRRLRDASRKASVESATHVLDNTLKDMGHVDSRGTGRSAYKDAMCARREYDPHFLEASDKDAP